MERLGEKLRKRRRQLGLSLDDLAGRAGISKPYLSLIETGRVVNPPSDTKLRTLEHVLSFSPNELIGHAHLLRTPSDIRAVLASLAGRKNRVEPDPTNRDIAPRTPAGTNTCSASERPLDLDQAYLAGVLHQLVGPDTDVPEPVRLNPIPIINRVSAGYPRDFTDLAYPKGVADEYVGCPGLADPDAFAARVHGDSMTPKYQAGDIVIFSPAAPTRDGDDCFVRFDDGQTTFKRVFFESTNDTHLIRLQPRNEKYRPQTLPRESITGLYRAVFRYQSLDE